ncbi:MAG: alkaline phosphatase family protein [Crocinitomicaceae bacterium]|nr:alkaline phosphatase family protein [Crocinitomicaceae bacterium]MCF8410215.1 alkaline phosphatase family protein [Crocinitomicaceae bacterium]MCF8444437.1 alkaline phosphatase family protein [Crocinitomicaceae bacterium]
MKRRVTIILVAFIYYVNGMLNFATNNLFTMLKIYLFLPFVLFCNLFVAQKNSNKIVVGVVVDQMCYDYLYRFQGKFGKGGFNKLIKQGANCRNTNYNYVPTYTGPGHASIYTGTTPDNHGIVGNEWYDRSKKEVINCVTDGMYQSVGTSSKDGIRSPKTLKTYTITDQLKMTYPSAKVISLSIKDRSAILPGGHLSDGSYWFDYSSGKMITSNFYKTELPGWVNEFNAKKHADQALVQTWNTYYPIETYMESGKDDSPYEVLLSSKDKPIFPYDLKELNKNASDYSLFTITPFANTYLTDFALSSIDNEQMGADSQTDFLCISYSTPDIAGHAFGPYSVEIEDIYIRLDLEIARLIETLEKKFGKNGFTLFLTADHAVVPVPQSLIDQKLPGGYLFLEQKLKALKNDVKKKFEFDLVESEENQNIYLNRKLIDSLHLPKKAIETFIAAEIRKWEGVKAVFVSEELENASSTSNWMQMVSKGYRYDRSGEVVFILEPGYLAKNEDKPSSHKGTSHGSAFNYDTHVPLIWYGNGIQKQAVFRPIEIIDIAPTLIHLLNLQRTGAMTGNPIVEILNQN